MLTNPRDELPASALLVLSVTGLLVHDAKPVAPDPHRGTVANLETDLVFSPPFKYLDTSAWAAGLIIDKSSLSLNEEPAVMIRRTWYTMPLLVLYLHSRPSLPVGSPAAGPVRGRVFKVVGHRVANHNIVQGEPAAPVTGVLPATPHKGLGRVTCERAPAAAVAMAVCFVVAEVPLEMDLSPFHSSKVLTFDGSCSGVH